MSDDRRTTFEAMYARDIDPWEFETSDYEHAKRAATIAMLGQRRFANGLEIGCSTGVLTRQLAQRCDCLLALDVAQNALNVARARLSGRTGVEFARAEVPKEWPEGTFDCIVFSELLYFLSAEEIVQVAVHTRRSLVPGGVCLLVNWTGPNELPVDGGTAVRLFEQAAGWSAQRSREQERYRLDLYTPSTRP